MNAKEAYVALVVPQSTQSAETLRNQLYRLSRWARISGDPDVVAMTPATFAAYRSAAVRAGLSADTAESDIGAVMAALRMCQRTGVIATVPWSGRRLRKRSTPRWVPTLDEIGRCYAHAHVARWPTYTDAGQFWRSFYVISLWCGLRKADTMFRLDRADCTPEGIRCEAHKTGRPHLFPMHPLVWRHLRAMPDTKRVFDVGLSLKQIRRELDRISDAAGVSPRIQPQAMRRASITAWEECAGAGRLIHGCQSDVVSRHYLATRKPPRLLLDGVDKFVWPEQMLTDADRDQQKQQTEGFLRTWKRLTEKDRETLRTVAERMVS